MDCARAVIIRLGFGQHKGESACKRTTGLASNASENVYLTVTGTPAEAGDDGEVGRGNRVNGLITPSRPMSLEAAAGKNPVSHVDKIYDVLATRIAEALVAALPEVTEAHCLLVSTIGGAVSEPALVHVNLATRDSMPPAQLRARANGVAADYLARVPELIG